jgi:dipeptidyl aminopeptidase/acylaminoacyl peptidase
MRTRMFAPILLAACAGSTPAPTAPPPKAPAQPAAAPAPVQAAAPAAPAKPAYSGHGAQSVAPEVVARYAARPLDRAVSRAIQAMLDIRGSGGGLVTSKADRIVFNWGVTGTPQVWRQDGPMRFPIQLTGGEDRTSALAITPDDRTVVVSRDRGGEENPGLYLLDIEGGPLVPIQHKPGVQTQFGFVSDDGRFIYFTSNDVAPDAYAIYRWDRTGKQRETLLTEPGLWSIADHQGSDRLLLAKELGSHHVEYYVYEIGARKLTPLLGQGETEEYEVTFAAKPGVYLVRTNKLGDFHRLYSWQDGKLTPLSPEMKHDVSSFDIDEARTKIIYGVNEDGYGRVYALDARTLKPLALPPLPKADNVYGGALTRNGRFANFGYDSATQPSTVATYDFQTRKMIHWRVPSTPEIDVGHFARAALERYPARDGTQIPMFVWRPKSCDEPCPVLVDFHGGPEGQAVPGFSVYPQIFVDAGYVFVEPNVRGSTGYGKTWEHADDGPKRLDVITDIEDCARFIKKEWAKDGKPPKIGVLGGSYGGYSTLMAMTYFAGAYDAGVEEVGIANLVTFLENTAPYRRILRTSEYGDPVQDRDALVKLSPVTYLDRVQSPLLLIQGVNDPRVPVGEALTIHDALATRNIDAPMILFADEGHGTSKRSNTVLAIGHTLEFFEKHLK